MVNHSNPQWTSGETNILLEHYQTKEMYKLQEILARYYFPRPPEGIKRRLEKLSELGIEIDKEKLEHLRKRKLWHKTDYEKFKAQSRMWCKNNPDYFKMWSREHPDYLKKWFDEHKEYSKTAKQRFLERHPNYYRNYKFYLKDCMDSLLPQIFCDKQELPLNEITSGIENLTGISYKRKTLEKILTKYKNNTRGSPLIKTSLANYKLNNLFYKT